MCLDCRKVINIHCICASMYTVYIYANTPYFNYIYRCILFIQYICIATYICACSGSRKHHLSAESLAIDILLTGASCVDFSKLKINKKEFAESYSDPSVVGNSSWTYKHGFKEARSQNSIHTHAHSVYTIFSCFVFHVSKECRRQRGFCIQDCASTRTSRMSVNKQSCQMGARLRPQFRQGMVCVYVCCMLYISSRTRTRGQFLELARLWRGTFEQWVSASWGPRCFKCCILSVAR